MRSSRGTTFVEAALVTPIFLMFIVAVAESGLYMRNYLAVANTVRAGARAASAAGAEPQADMYLLHNMAKESGAIPRNAIQYIVVYKASAFGGIPDEVGDDGVSPGCQAGHSVPGQCNVYTPVHFDMAAAQIAEETRVREEREAGGSPVTDESKIWFGCLGDGPHAGQSPDQYWCPKTRHVSYSGAGPDYVGVYMKIDHRWLTGIFGTSKEITDLSVIRMEPREL